MTLYPVKITFGELRESGVRDVLIDCRDHTERLDSCRRTNQLVWRFGRRLDRAHDRPGWRVGTATEGSVNQAISGAIARCRSMSNRTLGCGAHQVSVQRGWAHAVRCSEENILATGATLLEATETAHRREFELRSLREVAP